MLTSLVQSCSGNADYLVTKIIAHQKAFGDLIVNTLENIEQIKDKKVSALQKYYNFFKLTLKLLASVKNQEGVDEVFKQKAGALVIFCIFSVI